jgi:hypothetical protein
MRGGREWLAPSANPPPKRKVADPSFSPRSFFFFPSGLDHLTESAPARLPFLTKPPPGASVLHLDLRITSRPLELATARAVFSSPVPGQTARHAGGAGRVIQLLGAPARDAPRLPLLRPCFAPLPSR